MHSDLIISSPPRGCRIALRAAQPLHLAAVYICASIRSRNAANALCCCCCYCCCLSGSSHSGVYGYERKIRLSHPPHLWRECGWTLLSLSFRCADAVVAERWTRISDTCRWRTFLNTFRCLYLLLFINYSDANK